MNGAGLLLSDHRLLSPLWTVYSVAKDPFLVKTIFQMHFLHFVLDCRQPISAAAFEARPCHSSWQQSRSHSRTSLEVRSLQSRRIPEYRFDRKFGINIGNLTYQSNEFHTLKNLSSAYVYLEEGVGLIRVDKGIEPENNGFIEVSDYARRWD